MKRSLFVFPGRILVEEQCFRRGRGVLADIFPLNPVDFPGVFDRLPASRLLPAVGLDLLFHKLGLAFDVRSGFLRFAAAAADCSQQDSGDKGGEDHGSLHGSSFLLRNLDYKRVCPFIRLDGQTGKRIYAF